MGKKPTKTIWAPYDAADYLKSEKGIALYLDAVMDEAGDNPAVVAHALGDVARARRRMSQTARDAGVTREGLYKALSRGGNPSFATVVRAARALGFALHFRPVKRKAGPQPQRLPAGLPRPRGLRKATLKVALPPQ